MTFQYSEPYRGERCSICDFGFHDGQAICHAGDGTVHHAKCKVDQNTIQKQSERIARLTKERDELRETNSALWRQIHELNNAARWLIEPTGQE